MWLYDVADEIFNGYHLGLPELFPVCLVLLLQLVFNSLVTPYHDRVFIAVINILFVIPVIRRSLPMQSVVSFNDHLFVLFILSNLPHHISCMNGRLCSVVCCPARQWQLVFGLLLPRTASVVVIAATVARG